jgi:hypothetical protein
MMKRSDTKGFGDFKTFGIFLFFDALGTILGLAQKKTLNRVLTYVA